MHNSNKPAGKICSCPVETTTTFKELFLQPEKTVPPIIAKLQEPFDIELISGHIGNNLQINNQPIKSKTWSDILPYAENYDDFLKRLKYCKEDIYNLYFKCSSKDKQIMKRMFNNLNKTNYQLSYSPEIFTPRTEKRRFNKLGRQNDCMKYEETTYRTYYGRIKEMEHLKDISQGIAFRENKDELTNDLRNIKHFTRSTYHDEVSVLGKLLNKPTLPGPIDRYTLRRI